MKKILLILTAVLILQNFSAAQTPTPTPPEETDVVKISTTLIQLDVTVTDKKGNVIRDLKPEDFEIYENGKKQDISNFSFISASQPEVEKENRAEKNATPIPPKAVRPEQIRRTIALVVDDLTLSFASVEWVRQALKKFVNEQMQEGDLVAIIRTGAGIGALQQFTNDKRQLLAAIERVRFNLGGTAKIGVFSPIEPTLNEQPGDEDSETQEESRNAEREINELRESVFASGTLGAVNFIIRGMQELPGRKSIMLLSDGFSLFTRDENGFPQGSRILNQLRRLTDQANRASVVIYTIDARGLVTTGFTAEDDLGSLNAAQFERRLSDRRSELFDTQEGLNYLAEQTGGFAVINNNDISGGIRKVLNDQSYYLIGYQPDDDTFDVKTRRYNKLAIKVKRDGVRVRYRSGFFGVSDEQINQPSNLSPSQAILKALTSPFAVSEIPIRLNALFAGDEKQQSFVRSYVHIKGSDLTFTKDANGIYKAVFDLVALSFGDNGAIVDELSKNYTLTADEKLYQQIRKKGFVYYFTFPIKKSGGYQMRVVIRDKDSNKIGSANQFIEVPNLKKNRLTISGIVLENYTSEQWSQIPAQTDSSKEISKVTDPLTDTSLRQFKRGTILRFGYEIYNPKVVGGQKPKLSLQAKIFRDGKLFFEGVPKPFDGDVQSNSRSVRTVGVIRMGDNMDYGEYILQIIVTDNLAKGKRKIATQFVQFEIVE